MPCEIAFFVRNMNNTGNPAIDARGWKRGDVIEVQPVGFWWGPAPLGQIIQGNPNGNHPQLRIARLTNVSVAQAQKVLSPELDIDMLNPSPYLQRRGFFLDYTKIPADILKAHWDDDTRATPMLILGYTAIQINNIITGTDDASSPAYHKRVAF